MGETGRVRPAEELYTLDERPPGAGAVLVHAMSGFVDAGSGATLAARHLLETFEHRPVVTFDVDELHDYRARRPRMTFLGDHFATVELPELGVHEVLDATGRPFLLMTGPEPDTQWQRFVAAVVGLVERLGVTRTVGLSAVPWPVPHTRPTGLTPHATDRSLIEGRPTWVGSLEVPGHAEALLELRLGEAGHPAVGFTAHVPHYLSGIEYPPAAAALLEAAASVAGLTLPVQELAEAGVRTLAEVDEQLAQNAENLAVVAQLEQQYDAVVAARAAGGPATGEPLPSADEIGAQVERFLADMDERRPPDS